MVKGIYEIPSRTQMELLHVDMWWYEGVDFINQGFTYPKE